PMIVNSDERQWTWMDEGLNTFCQYIAEQEWEDGYPSGRGEPKDIVGYMTSANQVPIMTNSESILQFGANAYAKPATALNVLRETILGRELFDFAFREYSQRWMFKRPQPADLFRTLEDASAIDLDWFWRGWFYSTDHCDIAIRDVEMYTLDTLNPEIEKARLRAQRDAEPTTMSAERYAAMPKRAQAYPSLLDFYNRYDPLDVTDRDRKQYESTLEGLEPDEKALLSTDTLFYVVELENVGGLVMPVILQANFEDGTQQLLRVPAEIWRQDNEHISKLVLTRKPVASFTLDPKLETADADLSNNVWPPKMKESRFQLFKRNRDQKNPMQLEQQEKSESDSSATGGGQ
ncbi:MAG: M1 family aminopeptidase, partial [Planctomycetota bacterium]